MTKILTQNLKTKITPELIVISTEYRCFIKCKIYMKYYNNVFTGTNQFRKS